MNKSNNISQIATSIIIHDVSPNFITAYENYIERFKASLGLRPGFRSLNIIRPVGETLRYVAILRFDSEQYAQLWLNSKDRLVILDEIKPWLVNGDNYQTYINPDFWFNPAIRTNMPKRWKQFLLSWIGVLPWSTTIPILVIYLAQNYYTAPRILISVFSSLIISLLMTYISMPFITKKMAWWLIK